MGQDMSKLLKEIADFFAKPGWVIDNTTPQHIVDHFDNTWGVNAPRETVDNTPIFHGGVCIGSRQDLIDGKIDPTDRDAWKP